MVVLELISLQGTDLERLKNVLLYSSFTPYRLPFLEIRLIRNQLEGHLHQQSTVNSEASHQESLWLTAPFRAITSKFRILPETRAVAIACLLCFCLYVTVRLYVCSSISPSVTICNNFHRSKTEVLNRKLIHVYLSNLLNYEERFISRLIQN